MHIDIFAVHADCVCIHTSLFYQKHQNDNICWSQPPSISTYYGLVFLHILNSLDAAFWIGWNGALDRVQILSPSPSFSLFLISLPPILYLILLWWQTGWEFTNVDVLKGYLLRSLGCLWSNSKKIEDMCNLWVNKMSKSHWTTVQKVDFFLNQFQEWKNNHGRDNKHYIRLVVWLHNELRKLLR